MQVKRPAKFSTILATFALLLLTGCNLRCSRSHRDMTPDEVVEAYLTTAFNLQSADEKERLMEFTTGNLKAALASASDTVIQKAYVDRKYVVDSYSIVERMDRTPRETEITFRLVYEDHDSTDSSGQKYPKVTTENKLSLLRENGLWLIQDILGNKTSIAFPVMPESVITAKPGVITTPDNTNANPSSENAESQSDEPINEDSSTEQ